MKTSCMGSLCLLLMKEWNTEYMCLYAQLPPPPSDERKKVVEDVDRDRRYSIDAALVRTMKSRKILQHQQVCAHSLPSTLCPGPPSPSA